MRLYLGGQMVGVREFAHPEFNLAAKELRRIGHEVFNPAEKDVETGFDFTGTEGSMEELIEAGFSRREALAIDMDWIAMNSEGMVCLPSWRQSSGARAEAAFHHALGLPVWGLQDFINDGDKAPQILPTVLTHQSVASSPRAAVLDEAKRLITGDRNNQYGPPTQDFQRTAAIWNALGYSGPGGREMRPHDVAVLIIGVKLSRIVWTPDKKDHWDDMAGYSGCGWECVIDETQS